MFEGSKMIIANHSSYLDHCGLTKIVHDINSN